MSQPPPSKNQWWRDTFPWVDNDSVISSVPTEPYWTAEPIEAIKVMASTPSTFANRAGYHWPPELGETWVASCQTDSILGPQPPHLSPKVDCTCGIYAWKSVESVSEPEAMFVWRVGLSGRVVEHEFGYRAERVTFLSLARPSVDGMLRWKRYSTVVELAAATWRSVDEVNAEVEPLIEGGQVFRQGAILWSATPIDWGY